MQIWSKFQVVAFFDRGLLVLWKILLINEDTLVWRKDVIKIGQEGNKSKLSRIGDPKVIAAKRAPKGKRRRTYNKFHNTSHTQLACVENVGNKLVVFTINLKCSPPNPRKHASTNSRLAVTCLWGYSLMLTLRVNCHR